MVIHYKDTKRVAAADIARVFHNSGIRRPFHDLPRLQRMIDHGGMLITAWAGQQMVGVARAVSDFSYCCYLSDLAALVPEAGRREDTAGTAEAEAER